MKLLWLDLETTGLDATDDSILEVAYVLSDSQLFTSGFSTPCNAIVSAAVAMTPLIATKLARNPYAFRMHAENGLVSEMTNAMTTIEEIDAELAKLLTAEADRDIRLAGASVHFDLRFMVERMPLSAANLSHRVYDTTTLLAFAESIGLEHGIADNELPHRARNDIEWCIKVASSYREKLASLLEEDVKDL